MRNLRIVFMGTPEFAVFCLQKILESKFEVVGVVTAPDKAAGRGRKTSESAVKTFAVQQNLSVLQPSNLKDPEFLKELEALQPNLFVVVAFRMLPKVIWQLPQYGTFNLHASLLPEYRGAAPINWAIINGEKETGVTTFFIDEKIDTGNLILQEKISIGDQENVGSLHDRLMKTGAELIIETLNHIEAGDPPTTKQDLNPMIKEAPKLTRENTVINWKASLKDIYNQIRGLNPYPTAWTNFKNGNEEAMMKIYEAEVDFQNHDLKFGKIFSEDKKLKIALPEGFLILKEIQLPGKKKMEVRSLLNGYTFHPNAEVV